MDVETRNEMGALYDKYNNLAQRVTTLEANGPHGVAALERIERSVNQLKGHVLKGVWIILALFLAAVFKVAMTGNVPAQAFPPQPFQSHTRDTIKK